MIRPNSTGLPTSPPHAKLSLILVKGFLDLMMGPLMGPSAAFILALGLLSRGSTSECRRTNNQDGIVKKKLKS